MSAEYAFRNRPCFEQHKGQQHRIAHAAPNGSDGISRGSNTLYQHRIDADTQQNEQPLETNGKQGFEVVLAHAAHLTVGKGSNRDGRKTGHHVDLQHTAIDDYKNNDVQRPHGNVDQQRLHEKAQQGADTHCFEGGLQIVQHGRRNVR